MGQRRWKKFETSPQNDRANLMLWKKILGSRAAKVKMQIFRRRAKVRWNSKGGANGHLPPNLPYHAWESKTTCTPAAQEQKMSEILFPSPMSLPCSKLSSKSCKLSFKDSKSSALLCHSSAAAIITGHCGKGGGNCSTQGATISGKSPLKSTNWTAFAR